MDNQEKNVLLIALYRIFSRMYFYLPIIFPLFYVHGQTDLEIEILLAVYTLSIVLLSNLVRIVTDKIGHKATLILGELFKIISLCLLIFYADSFPISLVEQLMMGFGYTLIIGNDTVILQKIFKDTGSEKYQKIQAKTNSYMFLSLLFSGLCGALLFEYSSNLILFLSIIATIFSIISIFLMQYTLEQPNIRSEISDRAPHVWAVTYYCLVRGFVLPIFVGILPYLLFVLMKIKMGWFAIIISSFTLSGFISSRYFSMLAKKYTFLVLAKYSLLLIFIAISLLLFKNLFMCLMATAMLGFVSGCVRPVAISKIDNQYFNTEKTLKQAEFHYGVLSTFVLLSAGILLKYLSFNRYVIALICMSAIYCYSRLYHQQQTGECL